MSTFSELAYGIITMDYGGFSGVMALASVSESILYMINSFRIKKYLVLYLI